MTADELIHLISNQALNENMKEQHKLVIQDCCKELFKKKLTLCKYKKITYLKSKAHFDESCDELCCSSEVKTPLPAVSSKLFAGLTCVSSVVVNPPKYLAINPILHDH